MTNKLLLTGAITMLLLAGCTDKEEKKSLTEGGMKCGAGKCGASMVDGSTLLVKKKMNIADQMSKDDKRRDCVLKSKSTKALYNCVRDPKTGRLSIVETNSSTLEAVNKTIVPKKESNSSMKCESGKCTSGK